MVLRMLRKEQKWAAIPNGKKSIKMSRILAGRAVTVVLEDTGKGSFRLRPATYRYRSSCSHFDYAESEERFSRNKNIFRSLFRALKDSTIAAYIENLDSFLTINRANGRSDKQRLVDELKELTTR